MAEEKENKEEEKKEDLYYADKVSFSDSQKRMFQGFSEDLYGNNWFVLTTNDGTDGRGTQSSKSICGILDTIPELTFSTDVIEGPQKVVTDLAKKLLLDRDSVPGAIGAALGANINPQLGGGYTKQILESKDFQKGGFDLEFTAWRAPKEIFDPDFAPSSQQEVLSYLSDNAVVETSDAVTGLLDKGVGQMMAGLGSIVPVALETASEAGKLILGGNDSDLASQTSGFVDKMGNFVDAIAGAADTLLVRNWSDKQRITMGRTKFNESLHRLDILRAGILDTYFIVAIQDWSCELQQDSLGEKMKVSIKCTLDQRIPQSRLHLHNVKEIEGDKTS